MEELKGNPKYKVIIEQIKDQTWSLAQEMSKGGVNLDPNDVSKMLQTAMIVCALNEVRDELILSNQERRGKIFPFSMLTKQTTDESL